MNQFAEYNALFLLPSNISVEVLVNWLTTKCLVQLDSALCCVETRAKLHEIFESRYFSFHGKSWLRNNVIDKFSKWVIDRNINIAEFSLAATPSDRSITTSLLRLLGGSIRFLRVAKSIAPDVVSELINYCGTVEHAELYQDKDRVNCMIDFLRISQDKLTSLCLDIGENNSSMSFEGIILSSLKSIHLLGDIGNFNLEIVNRCPNLELLTLHSVNSLPSSNICNTVISASKLRCLVLLNPGSINMTMLREFLLTCPKLEVFEVSGTNYITDDILSHLVCSCPNLHAIQIGECHQITDSSLLAIATHCSRNLRYFGISTCWSVTPAGLEAITAACKNLLELTVKFQLMQIWRTTDLSSVFTNCPKLVALGLPAMFLTDSCLCAIANTCTELTFLSVCGAYGMIEVGVDTVMKNCSKLRRFCIYRREENAYSERLCRWDRPDVQIVFDTICTPFWTEYECSMTNVKYRDKSEGQSPFGMFSTFLSTQR